MKIISGGQTGVDRGALDGAIAAGVSHGGWCPKGRLAEDGRIPSRYQLRELDSADFIDRTRQNVMESDGTLILHHGGVSGGTAATLAFCREHQKPHVRIDAATTALPEALETLGRFVQSANIEVLNVAGPRRSEWEGGRLYARALVRAFCASIVRKES